jgi:hypothetical protein
MIYAELVKRLRSCAFTGVSNQQVVYVDKSALEQAAAAIEALERDAKAHEKEIAVWSENYAALARKLEAARADTKKAVEALRAVDALDPEGMIDGCSQSALRGLVLRMGDISRATLAEIRGEKT